jgi:hypothetical protein
MAKRGQCRRLTSADVQLIAPALDNVTTPHMGTYRLPWLCRSTPEGPRNERTGELIEAGDRLARAEAPDLKQAAHGLAALVPEAANGGRLERAQAETGQYIRRTCVFLGTLMDLRLGHADLA